MRLHLQNHCAQPSHSDNNVFNFSHLVNRSAIMGHVLSSPHPFRQIEKPGQAYERAGEGLWTWAHSDRTQGNGSERSGFDVRKKFFPLRALRLWNCLLREAVTAQFLQVSEAGLDGVWSSLGERKMSLSSSH